jgi:HTH-type transcriptional repressor of NAD biosynthesis genes
MICKRIGLTLGKYAPFHKGHQYVLETALGEMEELIVIIYDAPETTNIPLNIRGNWIKRLYPQVKLIEAWDGPTEVGASEEIKKRHEKYIIEKLGIKNITAFYSSEFYGEHVSKALGAENRLVDPERKYANISGTEIRKNPYSFRSYLDPQVYSKYVFQWTSCSLLINAICLRGDIKLELLDSCGFSNSIGCSYYTFPALSGFEGKSHCFGE